MTEHSQEVADLMKAAHSVITSVGRDEHDMLSPEGVIALDKLAVALDILSTSIALSKAVHGC